MIGKVTKGNGVQKLLWYLWGPGRANEHTDPHLIAVWGAPGEQDLTTLEPSATIGRPDVRALACLLEQPLAAQSRLPAKTVWQASLRLAPQDRRLTDAEWEHAAREVLHATGFAPRDDDGACRWIAMRHGPEHIHLAVVLARQDGQPVSTRNDFYKLGQACRDLEVCYDLRQTNPRDRTGPRRPSRAELEKAERAGEPLTPRDELRRQARIAASSSDSPTEFFEHLRSQGAMVRIRHSQQNPEQITGYAIAWPGDVNASGQPIWFGGSKLSADLSWSRLNAEWTASRSRAKQLPIRTELAEGHTTALRTLARQWTHGQRRRKTTQLEQARRAVLTLLLTATRRRPTSPSAVQTVLRDRAARSPSRHESAALDSALILLAARWAGQRHRTGGDLLGMTRAAAELLESLDRASVDGPSRESRLTTIPHRGSGHRRRLS